MKRTILGILMVLVFICSCAQAQERLADDCGDIHYVVQNGLLRIEGDRVEKIYEGDVRSVQVCGDMVYFVVSELADPQEAHPNYESFRYDTLMAMDIERNVHVIGEPLLRGVDYGWNDNVDYTTYTWHYGYSDMLIYKDHIYFMGDDGISGSYANHMHANEYFSEFISEAAYKSGAGVYRMDLDGNNKQLLISGLGNGGACMDISRDRIAVASVYQNTKHVYDYVDLRLYDMKGKMVREFKARDKDYHNWYHMDDAEFVELVSDIRTDGETIYVSLHDSEGDFQNARVADARDLRRVIYYEAHYVDSVCAENGYAALISDAPDEFYSYEAENTSRLCLLDGEGRMDVLAYVPDEFIQMERYWNPDLASAGDRIYLISGDHMMRVSVHGGEVQKLSGNTFTAAPEYAPDNYVSYWNYLLPESDVRLIEKEELKDVDKDTLALMRNEILARHGYPFKKAQYQEYFGSQSWYSENPDFDYNMLSKIEMDNVETIKKLEEAK